jgi:dTDP-4-dehydrorhamnose 3,5-epimerase
VEVRESSLPGVLLIEPDVFGDERGFFSEIFQSERYAAHGVPPLVQFNHSRSRQGTLRGLHYQEPNGQGKLVWVVSGNVFDVAVDVRPNSPNFGKWTAVELSGERHNQMWVPAGFAHGFMVLSETADFFYGCSDFYRPDCERAVAWNDPTIGIEWPADIEPILSNKDRQAPNLE